jgi:hypothetical protein
MEVLHWKMGLLLHCCVLSDLYFRAMANVLFFDNLSSSSVATEIVSAENGQDSLSILSSEVASQPKYDADDRIG